MGRRQAGPGAAPAAVELAAELAGVELPAELDRWTPSGPRDFRGSRLSISWADRGKKSRSRSVDEDCFRCGCWRKSWSLLDQIIAVIGGKSRRL